MFEFSFLCFQPIGKMNNDRFVTVVHYNGQMVRTEAEIVFVSESTTKIRVEKEITLRQMTAKIAQKIRTKICGLRYRWLTPQNPIRYSAINLEDDDEV